MSCCGQGCKAEAVLGQAIQAIRQALVEVLLNRQVDTEKLLRVLEAYEKAGLDKWEE